VAQVYSLAVDIVSHSWESGNVPSHFMLQKPEISTALMGHLAHKQTLPLRYSKLHALMKAKGMQIPYRMMIWGSRCEK